MSDLYVVHWWRLHSRMEPEELDTLADAFSFAQMLTEDERGWAEKIVCPDGAVLGEDEIP